MTFYFTVGILVGAGLIVAPFVVPDVPEASRVILWGFGAGVTLLFGILVVITRRTAMIRIVSLASWVSVRPSIHIHGDYQHM